MSFVTRTPSARAPAVLLAAMVVLSVVFVAVALGLVRSAGGAGDRWGELSGERRTGRFEVLSDAPAGTAPSWLPPGTRDVVVTRPGRAWSGDPGAVKIQAVVSGGWALPADCGEGGDSRPWDGGGDWPAVEGAGRCPDGAEDWRVFTRGVHVYLWKAAPAG